MSKFFPLSSQASLSLSSVSQDIFLTYDNENGLLVSGTYSQTGISNGKSVWTKVDDSSVFISWITYEETSYWVITYNEEPLIASDEDTSSPLQVVQWYLFEMESACVVAGAGTLGCNGEYYGGEGYYEKEEETYGWYVYYEEGTWNIIQYIYDTDEMIVLYYAEEEVETPDLVTEWLIASGEEPTPTVSVSLVVTLDPITLTTTNNYDQGKLLQSDGSGGYSWEDILIDITYSELLSKITARSLIPYRIYRLTDFATNHLINGVERICTVEPLIIQAISETDISKTAYSTIHPQDILNYEWRSDNIPPPIANTVNFKGYIIWRKDTIRNTVAPLDWRYITYRRWEQNAPAWSSVTTYNLGDIVSYPGDFGSFSLYASLDTNLNKIPSSTNNWVLIYFNSSSYEEKYLCTSSTSSFGIPAKGEAFYRDYMLFYPASNVSEESVPENVDFGTSPAMVSNMVIFNCGNNVKLTTSLSGCTIRSCSNSEIDYLYSCLIYEIIGSTITGYVSNSIIYSMRYSTIDTGFSSSIIGGLEYSHIDANSQWVYAKSIKYFNGYLKSCQMLGSFEYNTGKWQSCTFGNSFSRNISGALVSFSTFGTGCQDNVFAFNFSNNTNIGNNFRKNNIQAALSSIDFAAATHVYGNYSCTIVFRVDGTAKLMYVDNSNVQQIVDANA